MGLNRRMRRGITKISSKPFIETHAIVNNRLVLYINKVSSAITNEVEIPTTGDIKGSWEAIVFTRFINRFHLSGSRCQESFNSINKNDCELLKKIFIGRYDDLVHHRSIRKKETLKSNNKQFPSQIEVENVFEVSVGLFLLLLDQLDSWNKIDEETKSLLADVAFGCFTLFGSRAIGLCLEKTPSLEEYYKFVISNNTDPNENSDENSMDSNVILSEIYSLSELYTNLLNIAEKARGDAENISYAEQMDELISKHLPVIRESFSHQEDATIRKVLMKYITILEHIAKNIPLGIFEDEDFISAFRCEWLNFFNERFGDIVPIDFFNSTMMLRQSSAKDIKSKLAKANTNKNVAIEELHILQEQISVANFRDRPNIQAQITSIEEQIVKSIKERSEAENDGYRLMMPLEKPLNELLDDADVKLVIKQFHSTAKNAIKSWSEINEPLKLEIFSATEDVRASQLSETDSITEVKEKANVANPLDIAAINKNEIPASLPCYLQEPTLEDDAVDNETPQIFMNEIGEQAEFDAIDDMVDDQFENDDNLTLPLPHLELDVSHYIEDKSDSCERLRQCQKNISIIPALAADNIVLHWLKLGHLHLALKSLEVAGRLPINGNLFPKHLIKAAYQGIHVWSCDQATVGRILQRMNQLPQEQVDLWLERKPGNRLVPYLLFSATFQATIFAGNMTNAPRLLSSISVYFDEPVSRLINELVQFVDHNNRCDIDALREQPKTDDKINRKKIAERLMGWRDRVINKQTGWAPARKAMKECLNLPDFIQIINAIEKDDTSAIKIVRDFANSYRENEPKLRLMHSEILKVMHERDSVPQIEGNARNWFLRTIDEVIALSDEWLEEHTQQTLRGNESNKFARRFVTMSNIALNHLQDRIDQVDDFEQSVGLRIACDTLAAVCKVAENNLSVIWDKRRVLAWMVWPDEWLSQSVDIDDATNQMEFLMKHLVNGLDFSELTNSALAQKNFRHATLLLLYRRDVLGENTSEALSLIDLQFAEEQRYFHQRCDSLRSMLDNANVASLIDDDRHYQLAADVEHLQEQIKSLNRIDPLDEIVDNLILLETDIGEKFNEKVDILQKELDLLVNQSRIDLGVDSVPLEWLMQVSRALTDRETTVAEEMLDHLKSSLDNGSILSTVTISPEGFLTRFLNIEQKVYQVLVNHPNAREVIRNLISIENLDLDFTSILPQSKKGIESTMSLPKRIKIMDKELYEGLVCILACLGLNVITRIYSKEAENKAGFRIHGKFCCMTIQVKRCEPSRGFVFFDSEAEEQSLTILLASSEWTVQELRTLLNEQLINLNDRTILISNKSLSNDMRNDFASLCKRNNHTIYHVDPVLISILVGLAPNEHNRFKTFLQLSLPWTYFNPYTGNQMRPAPPEMRYGRQNDLKLLTTMHNGAAIIFGGRQLGKTTLLNESHRLFNIPAKKQHAFLHQMDGNLDRANLSGNEWEKHRTIVWSRIFNDAIESGLITKLADMDPADTESKVNAIHEYFRRPNAEAMLVCFDEIDRILGLDAANGFRIFRELSSLVNTSNGRFKVIIAGLENVRRFADAPNYPLHQLGSAIQVSIMNPNEAIELIKEPLGYLGYEFENALLVNRILVETNRHPGLIHIFCHELIKRLASRHQSRVGSELITADHIEQVRRDDNVRELICNRFEITLNLDLRYKLIAYSLILQGTNSFSSSRAKSIVEEWAPDIFCPMTEGQFEAFLDELCGLGVLHYRRNIETGKQYALRNTNILNLVGGKNKIEDKLLGAVESITDDDPLSGHAFPEKAIRPSPLTLRDEKLLISEENGANLSTSQVRAMSSIYSVGIIAGSEALGLKLEWMMETLPSIGKEEPQLHTSNPISYVPKHKSDTDFINQSEFCILLKDVILSKYAMKTPVMFMINITGDMPISHTLDLIDIAHEARLNTDSKRFRVRIIFLMHPKALWLWMSSPLLTNGRDALQPFIALDYWTRTSMAHLLNKMGLENTSAAVETLEDYSQRWYYSMDYLVLAKQKKPDIGRLSDFGKNYLPLMSASSKTLSDFLNKTGVLSVEWGLPLLSALIEQDDFDEEDVVLQLMELKYDIEAKQALRWLAQLRIIEPVNNPIHQSVYRLTYSVAQAIKARVSQEARA